MKQVYLSDLNDKRDCPLLAYDFAPEGNGMVTGLRVLNVDHEPKVKPAWKLPFVTPDGGAVFLVSRAESRHVRAPDTPDRMIVH